MQSELKDQFDQVFQFPSADNIVSLIEEAENPKPVQKAGKDRLAKKLVQGILAPKRIEPPKRPEPKQFKEELTPKTENNSRNTLNNLTSRRSTEKATQPAQEQVTEAPKISLASVLNTVKEQQPVVEKKETLLTQENCESRLERK